MLRLSELVNGSMGLKFKILNKTFIELYRYKTRISNAFNAIYVNTVNTRQGHFIQSRVQFSHLITLYVVLCKSHKHQCQQCQ